MIYTPLNKGRVSRREFAAENSRQFNLADFSSPAVRDCQPSIHGEAQNKHCVPKEYWATNSQQKKTENKKQVITLAEKLFENVPTGSYQILKPFLNRNKDSEFYQYELPAGKQVSEHLLLKFGYKKSEIKKLINDGYLKDTSGERNPSINLLTDDDFRKMRAEKERQKEQEESASGFIFNPEDVWKKASFPFARLKNNVLAFGILMPKHEPKRSRDDKYLGVEQVFRPVMITSDHRFEEFSTTFQQKNKVSITSIPGELPLRWSLPEIQKWYRKETPEIDGKKLYQEIRKTYSENVFFFDETWYDIHTLWDMATYFFGLFAAFPIMELRGMKGTAKSRVMKISAGITFNGGDLDINPSEAVLFRKTNDTRYTKYIDEAERMNQFDPKSKTPVEDSRIQLINASYENGSVVTRLEKVGEKFYPVNFEVYSPTCIGSITGLQGATESRAIIHIMTKIPGSDRRGENNLKNLKKIQQEIRDKLYPFALQKWQEIEKGYDEFNNETKLRDRDFLIWKPLLTLAKFLDNTLFLKIKTFAEHESQLKQTTNLDVESIEGKACKVIWQQLSQGRAVVLLKDVLDAINYNSEYQTHPKTLATRLDKIGLLQFKEHFENGNGYRISKDQFQKLIEPLFPLIFSSFPSFHSGSNIKGLNENKKPEANTLFPERNQTEANEQIEANERNIGYLGDTWKNSVFAILRELTSSTNQEASFEEIKEWTGGQIDDIALQQILDKLKNSGEIFEPRSGKYKVIT